MIGDASEARFEIHCVFQISELHAMYAGYWTLSKQYMTV